MGWKGSLAWGDPFATPPNAPCPWTPSPGDMPGEGAHRCASPYVRSFSFRFRRPQDCDSVRKVIACACISKALRAFRDTVDFRGFAQLAETFLCGRARCARVIMLNSRNNNNNKHKIKNQDKNQGQEHGQEHRQSTIITTEEPASARPTSEDIWPATRNTPSWCPACRSMPRTGGMGDSLR